MISGIVLAAGASSRMGQAKAALPLGQTGETVLSRVVRTLLDGGVPERGRGGRRAHRRGARGDARGTNRVRASIEHPGWQQGQLSSLLAGLDAIDTPLLEAALVTLVDVPLVRRVHGCRGDRGVAPHARADRPARRPFDSLRQAASGTATR